MNLKPLVVVMGVSGTGKSTIGKLLSEKYNVPFYDGDDYHPKANIEKMASGKPLNDHDRHGWLEALNELLLSKNKSGAIVACSALKESYRAVLSIGLKELHFVFLDGSFEEVKSRLESREGHFMPSELLQSQFDTLEKPEKCIRVEIKKSPEQIVLQIETQLNKKPPS